MKSNDEILWHIAKRRAAFRKQLFSYMVVNLMLWAIWFISGRENYAHSSTPWPVWVMFWWGVGLAFSFGNAYVVNTRSSIEHEYQKLKNNHNQ